jgi:hypothetical protein
MCMHCTLGEMLAAEGVAAGRLESTAGEPHMHATGGHAYDTAALQMLVLMARYVCSAALRRGFMQQRLCMRTVALRTGALRQGSVAVQDPAGRAAYVPPAERHCRVCSVPSADPRGRARACAHTRGRALASAGHMTLELRLVWYHSAVFDATTSQLWAVPGCSWECWTVIACRAHCGVCNGARLHVYTRLTVTSSGSDRSFCSISRSRKEFLCEQPELIVCWSVWEPRLAMGSAMQRSPGGAGPGGTAEQPGSRHGISGKAGAWACLCAAAVQQGGCEPEDLCDPGSCGDSLGAEEDARASFDFAQVGLASRWQTVQGFQAAVLMLTIGCAFWHKSTGVSALCDKQRICDQNVRVPKARMIDETLTVLQLSLARCRTKCMRTARHSEWVIFNCDEFS